MRRRADDGDVRAFQWDAGGVDQFDDGEGGAGGDDGVAVDDVTDVGGVDAFDVFEDVDLVLGVLQVEGGREGRVEEDAGDGGVGIEPMDRRVEVSLSGRCG